MFPLSNNNLNFPFNFLNVLYVWSSTPFVDLIISDCLIADSMACAISIASFNVNVSPSLSRCCCMLSCLNPQTNQSRSIFWRILWYLQCSTNHLISAMYSVIDSSGVQSQLLNLAGYWIWFWILMVCHHSIHLSLILITSKINVILS